MKVQVQSPLQCCGSCGPSVAENCGSVDVKVELDVVRELVKLELELDRERHVQDFHLDFCLENVLQKNA